MAANVKHLAADGATQITSETLADVIAGVNQTPFKLGFESVSDRTLLGVTVNIEAVGDNDGSTEVRILADPGTLPKPINVIASLNAAGTGGVWGSTGVKGFRVTAVNAIGETMASEEVTVNVDVTTKSVTLTWNAVTGATGYKVYDTDSAGTYTSPALRASVSGGGTTSYVDNGGTRSTGTIPEANTTGDWLLSLALGATNSGGVWGGTGPYYYRVTALDSTGAILASSREFGVTVDSTSKRVTASFPAVATAAQYNLYRTTSPANYASPAFVNSSVGLSVIDTGLAASAGTVVIDASYGNPPDPSTFGTAAISEGDVAINMQKFYWARIVAPSTTPEVGNPRLANIVVKEA